MIRDITSTDLPTVLALNNAHAVEVNALTADALAALVAVAAHARVVDGGDGFLIAFSERTPVQGPNHAWFVAHYPAFLYIDRVVIAPGSRGLGHARRLYDDLAAIAAGRPWGTGNVAVWTARGEPKWSIAAALPASCNLPRCPRCKRQAWSDPCITDVHMTL